MYRDPIAHPLMEKGCRGMVDLPDAWGEVGAALVGTHEGLPILYSLEEGD